MHACVCKLSHTRMYPGQPPLQQACTDVDFTDVPVRAFEMICAFSCVWRCWKRIFEIMKAESGQRIWKKLLGLMVNRTLYFWRKNTINKSEAVSLACQSFLASYQVSNHDRTGGSLAAIGNIWKHLVMWGWVWLQVTFFQSMPKCSRCPASRW